MDYLTRFVLLATRTARVSAVAVGNIASDAILFYN